MRLEIGKCYVGFVGGVVGDKVFQVIEADDRGWVRAKVWEAAFVFKNNPLSYAGEKWINTNQFQEIKEWNEVPNEDED
ncbi:MAG: hypothetical protein HY234_03315 [Acidobacteria bacterium]|nr:hypothetical protein [Acidobacteriota bacterium]